MQSERATQSDEEPKPNLRTVMQGEHRDRFFIADLVEFNSIRQLNQWYLNNRFAMKPNKNGLIVAGCVAVAVLVMLGLHYSTKHWLRPPHPSAVSVVPSSEAPLVIRPRVLSFEEDQYGDDMLGVQKVFNRLWQLNMPSVTELLGVNSRSLSSVLREENNQFVFSVNVPGVDPKAIDISIENRTLVVKAQRDVSNQSDSQSFVANEKNYDYYYRLVLPDNANVSGVTAKAKNGVLTLTVPKEKNPSVIKINVSE